jgi:TPP-dependent pyruvate/acetoin dehydrogenase alpha subunit
VTETAPMDSAGTQRTIPIDVAGRSSDELHEWLATMLLIRELDTRSDPLALEGKVASGIHTAVGQEAVAVGAIRALRPSDLVVGAHRTHHHAIAKGLTARSIMAEFFGKATGCCGGRGGEIHLADVSIGYLGGNAMVGTGVGIGMGAALAAKMRRLDQVVIAFFGDGGANTGRTWEHINMAAIWKLPLIIVCENNQYAVTTRVTDVTAGGSITRRAESFGVRTEEVDGQDVAAMYRATSQAVEAARAGTGPSFIEAVTYRYFGHSTGQDNAYRTTEEIDGWRRTKDPIARLKEAMEREAMLTEADFEGLRVAARASIDDAIAFAEASPWPDRAAAIADVTGLELGMRVNPWQSL